MSDKKLLQYGRNKTPCSSILFYGGIMTEERMKEIYKNSVKIKKILEEINELDKTMSLTNGASLYLGGGNKGGKRESIQERLMLKREKLYETFLEDAAAEHIKEMEEIAQFIESAAACLSDNDVIIICDHYINGKRWIDIERENHYDKGYTTNAIKNMWVKIKRWGATPYPLLERPQCRQASTH